MNVNRLLYNIVGVVRDNSLDFEHFPPATPLTDYVKILRNACENDLHISRDLEFSLRHEVHQFLF